ncbi:MAG: divergent polysaccharide deacetylase family protein [Alphaproteobacteria bacterium]|nr:divergent polysaccharide deacetylase family protein [Alphaproteobacteria bacterium]
MSLYDYKMLRFVKPKKDTKKTMLLVVIGATLMLLVDFANTKINENNVTYNSALVEIEKGMDAFELDVSEIEDLKATQSVIHEMSSIEEITEDIFLHIPQPEPIQKENEEIIKEQKIKIKAPEKLKAFGSEAKIAIIIDDIGMDRVRSYKFIELDSPLTLSFLPYAPKLKEITSKAKAQGHELFIHVPMEPLNSELDPGPLALLDDMDEMQLTKNLEEMFNSFDGYVGINNHMGSKVTQNEAILHHVMSMLSDKGLIFVDSKTIHNSLAGAIAAKHGLYYAERDVFLDHVDTPDAVRKAFSETERIALKNGVAVAIGHPKDVTFQALKEWLPDVQKRGFTIVPVSAVVKQNPSIALNYTEKLISLQPAQLPAQPHE